MVAAGGASLERGDLLGDGYVMSGGGGILRLALAAHGEVEGPGHRGPL